MDAHDAAALQHYEALIAQRYPPHLAAALVAARYQQELERAHRQERVDHAASTLDALLAVAEHDPLPVVRETLVRVQEQHPDLKRDVGRTVAAIDRKGTIKGRDSRRG